MGCPVSAWCERVAVGEGYFHFFPFVCLYWKETKMSFSYVLAVACHYIISVTVSVIHLWRRCKFCDKTLDPLNNFEIYLSLLYLKWLSFVLYAGLWYLLYVKYMSRTPRFHMWNSQPVRFTYELVISYVKTFPFYIWNDNFIIIMWKCSNSTYVFHGWNDVKFS